jgi:hypothetical protein
VSTYCSSLNRSKKVALRLSGMAPSDATLYFPSIATLQSPSTQTTSIPQRLNLNCESAPKMSRSAATPVTSSRSLRKTRVSYPFQRTPTASQRRLLRFYPTKKNDLYQLVRCHVAPAIPSTKCPITHSMTAAPENARSQSSSEYVAESQCPAPGLRF